MFVVGDAGDEAFVIAVLERPGDSALTITVEGDLSIGAPEGRLSFAAARGVDVASSSDVRLTASEITLRAPRGQVLFDNLSYLGSKVFAQFEGVKLVGRFFDAVLERMSHKVKRSYKVVEELDHVRSEQIDYRAAKNLSLRGQNALVTAKELVKIDGDQIHLG